MGKVLTQAQKTFTDLYDSYVLNLSSDIVAVPCNQDGQSVDDYEATVTYNAVADSNSIGVTCTGIVEGTALEGVQYNISNEGKIIITVPKDLILPDDAETGFTFTTNNSSQFVFKKYITFIKIQQGTDGENARSFQIKSVQGDTFDEGINSITMTAVAFDGVTQVNDVTYAWYRYTNNQWTAVVIGQTGNESDNGSQDQIYSEQSLTIYKADAHDNPVFKCVVTYSDGETDEDYFQLKNIYHNYESTVKFFGGTNAIERYEPFVVAYVDLYKDHQKANELKPEPEYYYYNKNNVKKSDGSFSFDFSNVDSSHYTDGNRIYTIYKDESVSGTTSSNEYTITAQSSSPTAGTVTGGGTFNYGANVTLTATPNDGYEFTQWSDGSTETPRTVTVEKDATYTANFSVKTTTEYTVTVQAVDTAFASAPQWGSAYVDNNTGSQTCKAGSTVTINAAANTGYVFVDWYENNIAQNWTKSMNITVNRNRTLKAMFRPIVSQTGVATTLELNEDTSITAYKAQMTYLSFTPTTSGTYRFYSEENFPMNAYLYTADLGTTLVSSEGMENGDNFSITYRLIANQTYCFAVEINDNYTDSSGTGIVKLEMSTQTDSYAVLLEAGPGGYIDSSFGTFEKGTEVHIEAKATAGYEFAYWQDKNGNRTNYARAFYYTVNDDLYLKAIFSLSTGPESEQVKYIITAEAEPASGGSVSGGGSYLINDWVVLTATPADTYKFKGWYIDNEQVSSNATYSFYADQTATYVARFEQQQGYTVTVVSSDTTRGTVSGGGTYESGKEITISAIPYEGYTFLWWNDDDRNATRTITVDGNKTYIAYFEVLRAPVTITVQANDDSYGTVSGGGTFEYGQTTYISAQANTGYQFNSWHDGDWDNPRLITAYEDATYIARFTPYEPTVMYTVTAQVDPVNSGTVSGHGEYQKDSICTLEATAYMGYRFDHWEITVPGVAGVTTIVSNPYSFQVTRSATYKACFTDSSFTITVQADPTSGGTVSQSGNGSYASGERAWIYAQASEGYVFSGWYENGVNISNYADDVIYVTGNRTLTAQFTLINDNPVYTEDTVVGDVLYIANGTTETNPHRNETNFSIVVIPDTVKTISSNTFSGCTKLQSVVIPDSVTSIGGAAFYECTSLTNITIPDSVTSIGNSAFLECICLESVNIGCGVLTINRQAFLDCDSLNHITLGSNVTTIGDMVFAYCDILESITIPKSVTSIGSSCFIGTRLTDVYYEGTEEEWNRISVGTGNEKLNNVTIHYNSSLTYAAAPMMMRSVAPAILLAETEGIETYDTTESADKRARYKAALCQYNATASKWDVISDPDTYVYRNDLYSDVFTKVIVVSKEDVTNYRSIDVTTYKKVLDNGNIVWDNDLIVSNTSFTVFDVNDTIIDRDQPDSANNGQLWLDTSKSPFVLYIYQNGEWVRFNQQEGQTIYTERPTTYMIGDIWILTEDFIVDGEIKYGQGTMLRAEAAVTVPGGFHISHWTDANPDTTNAIKNITESFKRDNDGISIVHEITKSGQVERPFYVHINSQRMGFYDKDDIEVVHIGNNSAAIKNATFQGEETIFETKAEFQNRVDIVQQNTDGSTHGFAFQTEDNGSFSLILVGT